MSAEVTYTLVIEETQHEAKVVLACVMQHYEGGIDGPYTEEDIVLPMKFRDWANYADELGFRLTGENRTVTNYLGNPVHHFGLEVKP